MKVTASPSAAGSCLTPSFRFKGSPAFCTPKAKLGRQDTSTATVTGKRFPPCLRHLQADIRAMATKGREEP